MAAAVKGSKLLEDVKGNTVVTTYTSGSPVAPAAGTLAVYFDLADADEHRAVEIANRLKELISRARELNYSKPTAAAIYLRCPLNGSKHDIEVTTDSTDIVLHDVAIGISATVRSGESGSILFDSCFQQIIDKMWEQYGAVDSAPTVAVNTGATVDQGDSVVITSSMLRVSDSRTLDEDLIIAVTSGPANGQMEYVDDPAVAVTSFTQGDINDGNVAYVHDDSVTVTGAFGFSVTNGFLILAGSTFAITVTPT